jgi:hypothetical protein
MINLTKNNKKRQNLNEFIKNIKLNPYFRNSEFENLDYELGILEIKHRFYGMDAYFSEYYNVGIPFDFDNVKQLNKTSNIFSLEALISDVNNISNNFKNIDMEIINKSALGNISRDEEILAYEKIHIYRKATLDFTNEKINSILYEIEKGDNNDERIIAEYLKRK